MRKCGLSRIVAHLSGNSHGEANKLDTHSCNLFQWACLKQNITACLKGIFTKDRRCKYSREPLQHPNIGDIKCASTYTSKDIKRTNIRTCGSKRLVLPTLGGMRGQSFHSSCVLTAKGNSQNTENLTISTNRENGPIKTKPMRNRAVKRRDPVSEVKAILLGKLHNAKYYNILEEISKPEFLMGCYLLIKDKPGNWTKGVAPETLDGISKESFVKLSKSLQNGSFKFSPVKGVLIPKSNGKTRPLEITPPREKIVQKAMELVLTCI